MNRPRKSRSLTTRFLILLSLVLIAAIADYEFFLRKSTQAGYYEDLNSRLSNIRVSVTKLEYVLDMFVVAKRFEDTTVSMIQGDVDKLDLEMKELYDDPGIDWLIKNDHTVADSLDNLNDDWFEIKSESRRLSTASSNDEIMLIHNAVDLHAIMITEKTDQLLDVLYADSKRLNSDLKTIVQGSIIAFILFFLSLAFYLYKRLYQPLMRAVDSTGPIASGWPGLRFTVPGAGVVGDLTAELNSMLERIDEIGTSNIESRNALAAGLAERTSQMDVLAALAGLASRSLDESVLFKGAVSEAAHSGGADAAALYIYEGGSFRLKAYEGFDDKIPVDIQGFDTALYFPERDDAAGRMGVAQGRKERLSTMFYDPEHLPTDALGRYVGASGFSRLLFVPIEYDRASSGAFISAWRSGKPPELDNRPFFESLASCIGAFSGYIRLVQGAHSSRKFFERVIRQAPFGMAVFDRGGRCVVHSAVLRKLLGAPAGFDFSSEYRVADDEVFATAGVITSIEKAYDGYSTEMIINYNPALQKKYDFRGPAQKIRLRSLPLYDAGGEISEIALIYETDHGLGEKTARSGERQR